MLGLSLTYSDLSQGQSHDSSYDIYVLCFESFIFNRIHYMFPTMVI